VALAGMDAVACWQRACGRVPARPFAPEDLGLPGYASQWEMGLAL